MEVVMGLSRKREREFRRLKSNAEELMRDQREILEQASKVVRDASRQAANFAREEVRPAVSSGISATRSAAHGTREKLVEDVFPAVSSALSSALAVLEVAKNPQVRAAIARVSKGGNALSAKAGIVPAKPTSGPGRYILIGLGLVAFAGVAYAAWQTLRADDSLWVEDDPEPTDG
jgi:hypothetical protein